MQGKICNNSNYESGGKNTGSRIFAAIFLGYKICRFKDQETRFFYHKTSAGSRKSPRHTLADKNIWKRYNKKSCYEDKRSFAAYGQFLGRHTKHGQRSSKMFTKTLLPDTFRAIQLISAVTKIKQAYLAGGTALALQIGHRISIDLDFFTPHEFNETQLIKKLTSLPDFVQEGNEQWTVWGKINHTKFSIFYYKYPLLEPTVSFENIQLASLPDIAAMKIHAIEDRGTRRDFVDVYFLAKKYTLEEMLEFYQRKYAVLEDHLYSILRSLDYFEDAEQENQMPNMLIEIDWEEVKESFRKETRRLAEKKLQ